MAAYNRRELIKPRKIKKCIYIHYIYKRDLNGVCMLKMKYGIDHVIYGDVNGKYLDGGQWKETEKLRL